MSGIQVSGLLSNSAFDWKSVVDQLIQADSAPVTKLTAENVPAHFGITGSKTAIACKSFDTQANLGRIVQGKYSICLNCQYRISQKNVGGEVLRKCPKCGGEMQEVIAVTAPLATDSVKPKVKVL